MQERQVFEYALIRLMPRVERGEFINMGLVIFCKSTAFLKTRFMIDETRINALFPEIDISDVKSHLEAFESIAAGENCGSPIANLDPASRFRWLTAKRSTIIQASEVHPGLSDDLDKSLESLFSKLLA